MCLAKMTTATTSRCDHCCRVFPRLDRYLMQKLLSTPNHYRSTDILFFLNIQATFCSLLHTHNSPPNLHPPTTQQRPNAPLRLSSVFTTTYIPRPTGYKKLQSYHPPPTLHIMHPTTHTKHSLSHTPHPASHTW